MFSHFLFLLELSLHKQQKMFTAEYSCCFLLEGHEGQEGCLNLTTTQLLGSKCTSQVVADRIIELNYFLNKSQNVSSFFSV